MTLLDQAEEKAAEYFGCSTAALDTYCVPEHEAFIKAYQMGQQDSQSVMPKWTYLPELPEINHKYLFSYEYRGGGRAVKEVYFTAFEKDMCERFPGRYIAWMPLPPPCKQKDVVE